MEGGKGHHWWGNPRRSAPRCWSEETLGWVAGLSHLAPAPPLSSQGLQSWALGRLRLCLRIEVGARGIFTAPTPQPHWE